jgi:hypothetical protein
MYISINIILPRTFYKANNSYIHSKYKIKQA